MILSALLLFSHAFAQQIATHSYEYREFPTTITIDYKINSTGHLINMNMRAKVMGVNVGDMQELTMTKGSGELYLDSRCRNPKSSTLPTTCYSSIHNDDSVLLFLAHRGPIPVLQENMTVSTPGVERFVLPDLFPQDAAALELHNASSLFYLLMSPDFGMNYQGREYLVTGNKQFFKVTFKLIALSGGLIDVRLETKSRFGVAGKNDAFPGRVIVDTQRNLVTKLYLTVKENEYVLSLK